MVFSRVLFVASWFFLAAPTAAQILSLGSEQLISASGDHDINQRPRVLFTDDGAAHLAWVRGSWGQEGVFVMTAPSGGGSYGTPAMLSAALDGVRYDAADGLTLKRNGSQLVCSWEGTDYENRPIWFSRSTDAGSTWEAAAQADPGTVEERAYTCGAPFSDGRVSQVWMVYESGTAIPDLRWTAQNGQGDFGPPTYPAEPAPEVPCECCNPDQAVLDDGSVVVAFRNNQNNQRRIFVSRSTDEGATWPTSIRLDTSSALFFVCPAAPPSIAADGQDLIVAWGKAPGFPPNAHVYVAVSADGGQSFTAEIRIDESDGSTQARNPHIARVGDFAVIVWTADDPVSGHSEIWTATSVNGGYSWGTPQMITGDALGLSNGQATVAISPVTLDVEIVWRDNRAGSDRLYRVGGTLDATGVEVAARPVELFAAPNPFVSGTTLRFDLPRAAPVQLLIHDVAGRRVTEVSRTFAAGPAQVRWDGRDAGGRTVAPGVYFVRLESSVGVQDLRIVRVR
jgi:hypothetical protein